MHDRSDVTPSSYEASEFLRDARSDPHYASAKSRPIATLGPCERERRGVLGRKKERQNRRCRPVAWSSDYHLSCSCCFHCVVSLTLRVATREKSKRERERFSRSLFLSLSLRAKKSAAGDERVCNMCPALSFLLFLRHCVSTSINLLLVFFRRVMMLFFRPKLRG